MKDISFVILTWNSEKYINQCLSSLLRNLENEQLRYEIYIVDNCSVDGSTRILREFEKNRPDVISPIFLNKNMGTTISRNIALRKVRGSYICIMDSDVEVSPGVITKLMQELDMNPSAGMAVPKICYPNGAWQKSVDHFPTFLNKLHRFFRLRKMESEEGRSAAFLFETCPVDYAISAMWLFRLDLLYKVGFLDEKIFYSPEDVDYCLRIWKAGFHILYVPSIQIIHHTQEISRGWNINRAKISHLQGLFYLFLKHRYFFRSPNLKP